MASGFGAWLENARGAMSQRALAKAAGVSSATVSKVEDGLTTPSRDMVEKLAVALAGDEPSEHEVEQLVASALFAAGFVPPGGIPGEPGKVTRSFDPDDPRVQILDAADSLAIEDMEGLARLVEAAAKEFRKLHPRTDTFGKRADDEEDSRV